MYNKNSCPRPILTEFGIKDLQNWKVQNMYVKKCVEAFVNSMGLVPFAIKSLFLYKLWL